MAIHWVFRFIAGDVTPQLSQCCCPQWWQTAVHRCKLLTTISVRTGLHRAAICAKSRPDLKVMQIDPAGNADLAAAANSEVLDPPPGNGMPAFLPPDAHRRRQPATMQASKIVNPIIDGLHHLDDQLELLTKP